MKLGADTLIQAALAEWKTVHARVARRVGDAHADDVTQNVYERAVKLIRRGVLVVEEGTDLRDAIRGWLHEILFYVCLDHMRREATTWGRVDHADMEHLATPDPLARLEAREQLRVVGRVLTKWERPVIEGAALGETIAETIARLRIPPGTVTERERRARRFLKKRRPHEK